MPIFLYTYLICQDLMNRDRKDRLPEMQVDFIDSVCSELYKVSDNTAYCGHGFMKYVLMNAL